MTTEKGGRPLKFNSPEELQKKIDAYFAECDPHMEEVSEWVEARHRDGQLKKDENGLNYLVEVTHRVMTKQIPYTVTGLALALDTSRETLVNYEEKAEYFDTIKRAKEKIQNYLELNLNSTSPTGTIFNLKNNYGWKDKTESEITNPDGSLNPYRALNAEELRKLAK
jgi:hypothetical protein